MPDQEFKVAFLLGTRPEAIKLSPIVLECRKRKIPSLLLFSGQQETMGIAALRDFELEPLENGKIMSEGQSLTDITERSLRFFSDQLKNHRPNFVVVQGDTTATLTAALAAFYHQIPVAHVEAGLRSFRKDAPFPEELNRCLVGQIADLHFAPTEQSYRNLLAEGISEKNIEVVGNTVVDAFKWVQERPDSETYKSILERCQTRKLILFTLHRRETLPEAMDPLLETTAKFAADHPELFFFYPVHPRSEIRERARHYLGGLNNVELSEPVDYRTMVKLIDHAEFVITDSGGIQEECLCASKSVVILREVTERPEVVTAGVGILVGYSSKVYLSHIEELARGKKNSIQKNSTNCLGDGSASERIISRILQFSSKK